MGLPLHLSIKLGTHLMKMKLRRVEKFPMIVEIEPLFACNLKCVGCGKIQHPASELKRRMPVEQAVAAVEECGAPMVSIAGGEPLMHPQVHEMVNELVKRRKFVVLCTNAVLLPKHLHKFTPSKNFAWMVHIDGLREGKRDFACTPWGVPSYSLFGWQRPCYLLADGYAKTYAELLETTEWEKFGRGKDPRCDNCMAHCGYEPSAVLATMNSLRESIRATVSV